MKMYTRTCLLGLSAAAALGAGTSGAFAAIDAPPTRTVSYADLDLTQPAGAKVLYRRISAAAQQVCAPFAAEEHRDLQQRARQQACIDQAIGTAVQHVNSAALNEQSGKHVPPQMARN